MLAMAPAIDRIACALYDPATDLLKTFVNSTRSGEAIADDACTLATSSALQPLGLRDAFIEQLFLYAPLPDIGKIGIADAILLKEGNLTSDERQVIQTHGPLGLQILEIEADLAELEHQAAAGLLDPLVVAALTRQRADVEAIRQRFEDD